MTSRPNIIIGSHTADTPPSQNSRRSVVNGNNKRDHSAPPSNSRPTANGNHSTLPGSRPATNGNHRDRDSSPPPPKTRPANNGNNNKNDGSGSPLPSSRPTTVNGNNRDDDPPPTYSGPTIYGNQLGYPPPPPNYHHSSSSASFKGCCCCLFLLFSLIALFILAIVLVIVLAVKPKKPQFSLQQVGVQYVGINPNPMPSAGGLQSATVSLKIRMLFTAVNDNKVGIKYGESKFSVMYRGIPLGQGTVPGFYQPAHSVRQVETTVSVDRVNLLQADAADLIQDAALNDRVDLRILGDVGAKIRILGFTSPGVEVSVDCAIVISPRKQSVTYKNCGFDGLSV